MHASVKDAADDAIFAMLQDAKLKIAENLENFRFRDALAEVMNVAREGNRYLQEKQPWILAKTPELQAANQEKIDNCLHVCLQLTANLAIFLNPFLPFTAQKICHMLKVVDRMLDWENAGSMKLVSVGYTLRAPELLFKKVEDEQVAAQVEKLHAGLKRTDAAPAAPHRLLKQSPPRQKFNTTISRSSTCAPVPSRTRRRCPKRINC